MKRVYLIIPLVAVVAFTLAYRDWRETQTARDRMAAVDPYAGRDGRVEAECELASGKLVFAQCGMPPDWISDYASVLRTQYQVELRVVAGCMLTRGTIDYVRAFNDVMGKRIKQLYGADVFEKAEADARSLFDLRSKAKSANQALLPTSMVVTSAADAPAAPTIAAADL